MTTSDTGSIQSQDVIRAIRYGNRTAANYVIDRVVGTDGRSFKVYAHREYGGQSGKFMVFDAETIRIVRSYR